MSSPIIQRWAILFAAALSSPLLATDPPPPEITELVYYNGTTKSIRFTPFPGAQSYTLYSATNAAGPFTVNTNFFLAPYIAGYTTIIITNTPTIVTNYGYEWRLTNATAPAAFYRVSALGMSSNAMLAGHVLNRLAYGPTPDELERVNLIEPQAYINEQLNFDGIPDTLDYNYLIETTNSIPADPTTNWTLITVTGTMATTPLYLFTTAPGDIYIDDIDLRPSFYYQQVVTNIVSGTNRLTTNRVFSSVSTTNLLLNGGFETGFTPWLASNGASASVVDVSQAHTGGSALHLISTTGGTAPSTNFVRQSFQTTYVTTNNLGDFVTNTFASTDAVTLSYWYLPSTNSSKLRVQLGSGLNSSPGGIPRTPTWVYATATGAANANSRIYIYLTAAGEAYVDDVKLVLGTVPEAGPNLLANGGFEASLTGTWTKSADFTGSDVSATTARSGAGSLRLVATASGSGNGDSVQQTVSPALVNGGTYTVSYWYKPASPGANLVVKLDGNLLQSTPDSDYAGATRRLALGTAGLGELRSWFCQRAVYSPRQLFEVMSQFWENHFVTQQSKSADYVQGLGFDSTPAGVIATDWEYREMAKWRNAMLNPDCTFYDLLKISAESPAQIVYLDTVNSKGNNNNIANENYARELLELFTFGVDNGYDQEDIVRMSRAWTGWSVQLVDEANANNPFAPASQTFYPNTNSSSTANKVGVLAFNYIAGNHGTNRGPLFAGKTVPARFGPPWTTKVYSSNAPAGSYQLTIPARLTGTTNSIQDGYDVIYHLANLPFTQEYISVKLCRLFVHDEFPNPTTHTDLPEYYFYDYTNPNRSAEAELVRQCMLAWENSNPKGNIRAVLSTIFNSDLFRSHTAVSQKVKTPFEFVASSLRALLTTNASSKPTSTTDGYSFATPIQRMGEMLLFDRAAPDGYPEVGEPWISGGTLVERIRFVQSLCMTNGASGRGDAGTQFVDPVALLKKKLPGGSWNADGAVADYFLNLLFPGEGAANLALYRNAAINYLNTADDGVTASAFSGLGNTSGNYENRVRGLVAMLMAFQRFQEQ